MLAAARPGKYQARVRYTAREPGSTEMTVVSNSVPVEILDGNLAKWTCYRDLVVKQRADRKPRLEVTLRSAEVRAVPGGFAVVYVREERRRVDTQPRDRVDLGVQLFDERGLEGAPAVLGVEYVELVRAAASDRGLVLVHASGGFAGNEVTVVPAEIAGKRVTFDKPETLKDGLTIQQAQAVERSGGTIAVAYVRDLGDGNADLVLHARSAQTGAASETPVVLTASDDDRPRTRAGPWRSFTDHRTSAGPTAEASTAAEAGPTAEATTTRRRRARRAAPAGRRRPTPARPG